MCMSDNKATIATRGIPSKDRMYLPAWNSAEIRTFQTEDEKSLLNLWDISELLNFIFPKKYQAKYYEIAVSFMKFLIDKTVLYGQDISLFVKQNNISKATFYNRVFPRLKRIGMVKVERLTVSTKKSSQKTRPMKVSLSKTFGNYINKISTSWIAIVDDARSKKRKEE